MSSKMVSRMALRQSRFIVQRRAASTASEAASNAANKAKDSASEVAGKAQQGLSRVTSSAGSALSGAADTASRMLSGIGGRTGAVIKFGQSLVPPTIYYARVTGELAKLIFHGRGMAPPSMQTFQSYLTPVRNALTNPSSLLKNTASSAGAAAEKTAQTAVHNPETFITRLRNMDSATLTTVGIVGAEVIGFFSVGEIIGRFKIVGYHGAHGEHH
ncbi:Hypothetical protein R9X50_00791500 [Acrodontium crateriforme]|uniref:Uncharacterized protein n=1 Tax=Acrodontium crateriforme TaxID=150365 RepID=A0AAQ3MC53_9PEZI|nr:Hypothetical protein R9X50_00791500 [Acrodontium crateriforme]